MSITTMTLQPRHLVKVLKSPARASGFTLIELMIVLAVIAILAAIALPSYNASIVKTRRRAAEACLSQYANYMERYYTTNMRYDQDTSGTKNTALPTLDCQTAQQTGNYYQYTLQTANLTATAYVVQAAPQPTQNDPLCGTLTLNQAGARTISSSSGTLAQCW